MASSPDTKISVSDSLAYWNSTPITVAGMLGGYPQVSRADLKGSANFFAKIRRQHPSTLTSSTETLLKRGADCGAGIGRVTAGFLSTVCENIDVIEPIEKFGNEVRTANMAGSGQVGKVYVTGLENWVPEQQYDLIWIQWCLGHLKDKELVECLRRCKKAVTMDGWIVIKENMSTNRDGEDIFDETDSSVTRTNEKFQMLFKEADVRCLKTELQRGFPKGFYPVRLYALRP